jgi:hypothetical protein
MKISELLINEQFSLVNTPLTLDKEVNGIFSSDLLSHVMANAKEGNILITILNNINVLGVASLIDLSCVVFSHNTKVKEGIIVKANELDIAIIKTTLGTAETTVLLASLGI